MTTPCRNDCEYYSVYTNTCDYMLLTYRSRGCPVDACDKYKPHEGRRSWSAWNRKQGPNPRDIPDDAFDYIASLPSFDADTLYELMRFKKGCDDI